MLLSAEVLHVDIGAESHVVGKVPAWVVGIVVDHDLVVRPIPVIDVVQIKRSHTEVEAVKPKAVGPASADAPDVATAEATGEAAMFEGTIEVVACVVSSSVVSNPLAVVVNVRGFGVALLVAIRPRRSFLTWHGFLTWCVLGPGRGLLS